MNVFGGEWDHHERRLAERWRACVSEQDTVFLPGDISWGMSFEEALADFEFLHRLPGRKIISKGNHDYWWSTVGKMKKALMEQGLSSIDFLHNNAYLIEGKIFCGTKGYLWDDSVSKDQNNKILERERMRLELSLKEGRKLAAAQGTAELIALLHYPPVTQQQRNEGLLELMREYGVRRCYYGHIHGPGRRSAVTGEFDELRLALISADFLSFCPQIIE